MSLQVGAGSERVSEAPNIGLALIEVIRQNGAIAEPIHLLSYSELVIAMAHCVNDNLPDGPRHDLQKLLGIPGSFCSPAIFDPVYDELRERKFPFDLVVAGWIEGPVPWGIPTTASRLACDLASEGSRTVREVLSRSFASPLSEPACSTFLAYLEAVDPQAALDALASQRDLDLTSRLRS